MSFIKCVDCFGDLNSYYYEDCVDYLVHSVWHYEIDSFAQNQLILSSIARNDCLYDSRDDDCGHCYPHGNAHSPPNFRVVFEEHGRFLREKVANQEENHTLK